MAATTVILSYGTATGALRFISYGGANNYRYS